MNVKEISREGVVYYFAGIVGSLSDGTVVNNLPASPYFSTENEVREWHKANPIKGARLFKEQSV